MEKELDDIAEGQDDYFDAIDTFIKKFQPLLDEANEKMEVISPKKQERNVLNVDMILLKDMGVMVNL